MSQSNPERAKQVADELNWGRNVLVRLSRTFILFVSPDVLRKLSNRAPDFFDYRTAVFEAPLHPDPRFWLYDRISPSPTLLAELQSREQYWTEQLAIPTTGPRNPRDFEGYARTLIGLGKIPEADAAARHAIKLLNSGNHNSSTVLWVKSLQADILDERSRFSESLKLYEELIDEAKRTASQDVSLLRRLEFLRGRAGWYLGHDDEQVLVRLQSLEEVELRTTHLIGMVSETLGLPEGEFIHRRILDELSSSTNSFESRLTLSCAYHAARDRLTLGDLTTASREIVSVEEFALKGFGPQHDAYGFALLLEARADYASVGIAPIETAQHGLELIVKVHGVAAPSTLDATVQIQEMGLDPIALASSFMDRPQLETVEEAWLLGHVA
jgi:hypothetical protein